jgi:hypothetical protein
MTAPYRILVTGSRDWEDLTLICSALAAAAAGTPDEQIVLIHGACPTGADRMAAAFAGGKDWGIERHPADWDRYGKSAGFRRNAEMVALGANVCVAFIKNGSRGATHTADLAEKAGIPVKRYEVQDQEA